MSAAEVLAAARRDSKVIDDFPEAPDDLAGAYDVQAELIAERERARAAQRQR